MSLNCEFRFKKIYAEVYVVIHGWFFLRLFEQRCITLMNSMYNENPEYAINLMDDEAHVWGIHSSPLVFAYENFMYDVVAHTCSQKNMNKLWYNKLPPDLKPFLKVETLTYLKVHFTTKCGFFFSELVF